VIGVGTAVAAAAAAVGTGGAVCVARVVPRFSIVYCLSLLLGTCGGRTACVCSSVHKDVASVYMMQHSKCANPRMPCEQSIQLFTV
jgi:hypothetical protein